MSHEPDCECFRCKLESISIAGSAMPTRFPRNASVKKTEGEWHKDMAAYVRLKKDGLVPRGIDGSANAEKKATSAVEIEKVGLLHDEKLAAKVEQGIKDIKDIKAS